MSNLLSNRLPALALLWTALLAMPPLAQTAQISPLAQRISPGQWNLSYQRSGEFRPLFYKHKESGSSSTCIQSDPRQQILDWVSSKGCQVDQEQMLADRYRLSGQCKLKWMPRHSVPVVVDVIYGDASRFTLDIRTQNDPLLEFREQTLATLSGQCSAP